MTTEAPDPSPMEVMSPEDIARAWLACDGWEWIEGMRCAISWGCARLPWRPGDPVVKIAPTLVTSVSSRGEPWGNIRRDDGCGGHGCLALHGHDPLPDTEHGPTLAIIAHVLLPKAWPGHSVQVEVFPDGTARVMVFEVPQPARPGVDRYHPHVFRVSHKPVAVALLRALEASP